MNASISESRAFGPAGTPAFVYRPAGTGVFPSVVLLHERYGFVEHTQTSARRIAAAGYVVVAPDLFSTHPDQAGLQAGTIQAKPADSDVLALLEDAVAIVSQIAAADPSRLAMIGVCQTGRYPILYAAHHPLAACVILYGAAMPRDWIVNEDQPFGMEDLIERGTSDVFAIYGEKDFIISLDDVLRLRASLERHNRSYDIRVYENAPHGFANETMPGRYRPQEAGAAWDAVLEFLKSRLAREYDASLTRWSFRVTKHPQYDFSTHVRYD